MTAPEFCRPEFCRPERVDAIGDLPRAVTIVADPIERAALAARFGLIEVGALSASFSLWRAGLDIRATGRVLGAVVQACTVTGEPVAADIDEPVDLRFVADDQPAAEEVELSADACDIVGFDGVAVDLGETAAETLALALDPFPRGPDAEAALLAAGVLREEDAGPFGALAGLKDQLDRRS